MPLIADALAIVFKMLSVDDWGTGVSNSLASIIRVSSVSRKWRTVTLTHPSFWRDIAIDCSSITASNDLWQLRDMLGVVRRRARHRFSRFRLLNFPGTIFPAASDCWLPIFAMNLPLCDDICIIVSNFRDLQDGTLAWPCIHAALKTFQTRRFEYLRSVCLSVGRLGDSPHLMYHCDAAILASSMTHHVLRLQLNGISLGANAVLSCAHSPLTSLDLGTGTSYGDHVVPLLLWHHGTLQSLRLSGISVHGRRLVLRYMAALRHLHLGGASVAFLEVLRHIYVPRLSTIALDFQSHASAPDHLSTFARMHREAPVHELLLAGTGWMFSDFVPAISELKELRVLTLKGSIEPEFFDVLADRMKQTGARNLHHMELIYTNPLGEICPALICFLRCISPVSTRPSPFSLILRGDQGLGVGTRCDLALERGPVAPQLLRCGVAESDVFNVVGPGFLCLRNLFRGALLHVLHQTLLRYLMRKSKPSDIAEAVYLLWLLHLPIEMVLAFVNLAHTTTPYKKENIFYTAWRLLIAVFEVAISGHGLPTLILTLKDSRFILIHTVILAVCIPLFSP